MAGCVEVFVNRLLGLQRVKEGAGALSFHKLDNVKAVGGLDGRGKFSDMQLSNSFNKLRIDVVGGEVSDISTLFGRQTVFGIIARQGSKIVAPQQSPVNRFSILTRVHKYMAGSESFFVELIC